MQVLRVLRTFGVIFFAALCQKWAAVVGLAMLSSIAFAGEVKLYAAASLTDALTELSAAYEATQPEINIKTSFAGSSTLAKQIEHGASADIFISADNDWGDYLFKRGFLANESRKKLLRNELVLIAPLASDLNIAWEPAFNFSAAFTGRLCTGDTAFVPVGKYAKQALTYYGWWDKTSARIVGTEDVRTALAFVERAECSLGIVYKTDAQLSKKVKVVATFPAVSHTPIEYPGALTKSAGAEAKAFWMFLQSDQAKVIFTRYGFGVFN